MRKASVEAKRDELGRYLAILFACYCGLGLIGAWKIVDEFDAVRIMLVAWLGVPSWIAWHMLDVWRPHLAGERRKLAVVLAGVCLVVFGWANVLIVNALSTSSSAQSYRVVGGQIMSVTEYRGGFGHLYRLR